MSTVRGAIVAGLALSSGTLAVGAPPAGDSQVVITASRVSEELDRSLWSATVLTREDIQARQSTSLPDLLSTVAGVGFDNQGGLGKATNVRIRGAESDQTLLLIDGMRVGSATLGIPPFELIPVDQIERIEIVRGPRSTLYGSDAVGGVIQILTRSGARSGLQIGASALGASHETHRIAGALRAGGENLWLNAGAESLETAGINACRGAPFPPGGGCFTNEPDRDGYRNTSGSLAAGYRFNERLQAELRSMIAGGHTEYDGDFNNEADFEERVIALHVDGSIGRTWHARAVLGRNEDVQDNFHDGTPSGRYETRRDSASLQFDGEISSLWRAVVGLDYQDDRVASDQDFVLTSRWTKGVFTELHLASGPWSALAGVRAEDNEQFGNHVVENVGAGYRLSDSVRLSATWGTGFRSPTFNELYFPGFGDPNLEPEQSRSLEVGLDGVRGAMRWSLHAFETDFSELIAFDSATFSPKNLGDARIRGAELQAQWRNQAWQVGGQFTYLDPENRSEDLQGRVLPRRAKRSGSLDVRRVLPATQIGATLRWQGARFDDLANTVRLGSYTTVDLTADQSIGRSWMLQARVANVFDREYETAELYNQDGRYFSITLRYTLGESSGLPTPASQMSSRQETALFAGGSAGDVRKSSRRFFQ